MKTLKTLILFIIFTVLLTGINYAGTPTYKIDVSNLNYTSANTLEFDIYLLNTSTEKGDLRYSLGQYFFEFNPNIANGGNLSYSIVSSELPDAMRPRSPSVNENLLKLIVNSVNPDKSNLPVIPNSSPGILVAKMKLETSADKFADQPLDLKLSETKFKTKVFVYDGKKNIELTNSNDNSIDGGKIGVTSNSSKESISSIPTEFALNQNYPNPFNPSTKISYDLPTSNLVTLKVYDVVGKEIATLVNENLEAGRYSATFNGAGFASGIYYFRLTAVGNGSDFVQVRKMVLVK